MYRFFRSNHPFILIFVPILVGLYVFIGSGSSQGSLNFGNFGILSDFILPEKAGAEHKLFSNIAAVFILSIAVFIFIFNVNKSLINRKKNFLHGFIVLFISAFLPYSEKHLPVIFSLIPILVALRSFNATVKKQIAVFDFFNIGLLVSIASLFYFNALFFALIVFAGKLFIRMRNIREWLSAIIGLILPYFFTFSFYYVFEGELLKFSAFTKYFEIGTTLSFVNTAQIIMAFFIGLWALFASFKLLIRLNRMNIDARDYFKLQFIFLINALSVYFLLNSAGKELILFAAAPLSVILAYYFQTKVKIVYKELWFSGLIILAVIVQSGIDIKTLPLIERFF